MDFGLLDKNGHLLGMPVHYRDARTEGMMEKAFETISKRGTLRAHRASPSSSFNTLYQLLRHEGAGRPRRWKQRDTLLFMPDLIAYLLTGEEGAPSTPSPPPAR